jgi:peptidoglycan/xylan/chitin deacetylase (PgdA/CDA1 family)
MRFVDTYKELLVHKPKTTRDTLRHAALDLTSLGFRLSHRREKLFAKPRVQFLYIHHTFRDEVEKLDLLIRTLAQHHHFVSHSEAVERILTGNIDRPYISVSSDDGLRNNIEAARVLDRYGIKGCFFICPSIIDERDPEKIAAFARERLHFPPVEFLSWQEVETLQRQGHEIGGHTSSHINIARTDDTRLPEEIGGCFEQIKKRCGAPMHFAFPYGRFTDFSSAGWKLVRESGYSSCASAQRGCHITAGASLPEAGKLMIRRDHIILDWPLHHILYFIARSALGATPANNLYPALCE